MAIEETVVINTDTKSLSALKQEIKEIQAQLDLTPSGTKEYDNLVVKLRQAKGELKDFKETTKGLDPDQRAAKLVNAFRGMTGAIQAAAGAITLFGGSGKELEEVEKNLLGIIAIGGGVQSAIEGFNDAADEIGPKFKSLGTSIKGAFTTASGGVNGFKVALAGIGIGIAIAAVVALVEAIDELSGSITVEEQAQINATKAINEGTASVQKQTLSIQYYQNILNDTKSSESDRLIALKELKKLVPSLVDNDLKQANALANINEEIKVYNNNATKKAQIDALIAKKAENLNKIEEVRAQTTEELTSGFLNGLKAYIFASEAYDVEYQKEIMAIDARSEATNILLKNNKAIDEQLQTLTGQYLTAAKASNKYSSEGAGGSKKVLTASEKEVIAITNAIAAKQRLFDRDIENLKKAKNKELEGAIDSAEKREGIGIKYDALEVERGKQLGNDLLQIVKDSEKRLVKADETVLIKRAEVQLQGNKIINQQNLESINAAIKDREDATEKSNEQIEENLRTALSNSERALEVEQSFYAQVVEGYRELTADNYEIIFDDQDVFYNDLVKRLEEYGIEVDRETAEQIRQKGLARFKADEDAQLAQDQFYKQAIEQLRNNGEKGNAIADKLEQERKAKFDQNQLDKLASAVSFSQQEVDIAQNTADQILEIQDQFYSSLSQFANDYASLQSTLVQNELDRELYALNKRTEARIQAAGDDAEAVSRIQKDAILLEDDLRRKAFENEKQRKYKK